MKIALIGPGIIPIPPPGWGAVEILLWDYYNELTALGHEIQIINKMRNNPHDQSNPNTQYCQELINEINNGSFDFVHLHYDCLYHILPFLTAPRIGFTSHYPYINQPNKHSGDGFNHIFDFMINNNKFINFVLADKDIEFLISQGANPNYIIKLENGISSNLFTFKLNLEECNQINKTIYLGKITDRKGQLKYCNLNNIDIIGPGDNTSQIKNYKGVWTREEVHQQLTNYGNLLLLSDGEADPLVVKEALICGLGVVINETSGKNLSHSQPFITFIPDNKVNDLQYVQNIIDENRKISINSRNVIRQYAETEFCWQKILKQYIKQVFYFANNVNCI